MSPWFAHLDPPWVPMFLLYLLVQGLCRLVRSVVHAWPWIAGGLAVLLFKDAARREDAIRLVRACGRPTGSRPPRPAPPTRRSAPGRRPPPSRSPGSPRTW
ncbi:hypothetical protein GCM10023322_18950 [Rugosimonospora acidiphila]|uniref:Uncharacterized protein n=1 Tax=Rugosimonospora acidiphila TaxID=556531 RepID=A0ABP9RQ91_9ACTN